MLMILTSIVNHELINSKKGVVTYIAFYYKLCPLTDFYIETRRLGCLDELSNVSDV